ncbi:MbtH family protein [Streptomyces sp. NPDC048172]|uniref:MbtH family protein n=1 Tax=Streptomyces sp. NPDC048172 TaxID=3365505 RepID=UPI00371130BF
MSDAPTNPFDTDDDAATFRVLVNETGEHSLWPEFAEVPEGWTTAYGPCARQEALDWIGRAWIAR